MTKVMSENGRDSGVGTPGSENCRALYSSGCGGGTGRGHDQLSGMALG